MYVETKSTPRHLLEVPDHQPNFIEFEGNKLGRSLAEVDYKPCVKNTVRGYEPTPACLLYQVSQKPKEERLCTN